MSGFNDDVYQLLSSSLRALFTSDKVFLCSAVLIVHCYTSMLVYKGLTSITHRRVSSERGLALIEYSFSCILSMSLISSSLGLHWKQRLVERDGLKRNADMRRERSR